MNFNEEDIRSDVGFVCIGQAAGNIGLLFEEKGYNVLYINTSSEDLALLKNAKHVYHVPNGEGCAKDRDKAKYHLANDIDHLLDLIETKVPQKNVFVVFASGGGTGSGISPYLLNILVEKFSTDEDGELSANPAKLFSAITILPSDSEPLQPAINSYSCCKEILDIENLGTVFFIDNNSMEDKMKINKVFVSELDTVLSIPALHKSVKGNVDKAEIKKVIFETHGMGKILCRPRERGTAECIIHDLKDKSIYAPASLNGTVLKNEYNGTFVGSWVGDYYRLFNNAAKFFASNRKVIFENMERFQEKYDRKIEKRTQPHLNMRRSTNPVCSDVFGSIKDQIVNRTAEHGHLETMSLFDTPSDVNKMEKMNLFDSANKEEKQPEYIWEKTAITLEVFNNLLVPNWKTEKGLDRYLKTIGTRLAQLIDREEDRYYVLNKYKDNQFR